MTDAAIDALLLLAIVGTVVLSMAVGALVVGVAFCAYSAWRAVRWVWRGLVAVGAQREAQPGEGA